MAFASGVLVVPLSKRIGKIPIVVAFAIGYPTMLAFFSASAGDDEQGWVMGITMALFTLGSGMISLAGGANNQGQNLNQGQSKIKT